MTETWFVTICNVKKFKCRESITYNITFTDFFTIKQMI